MLTLRKYTNRDADLIGQWITDEKAFRLWCADRLQAYPYSADEFNRLYENDTNMTGNIALDDGVPIGHFFTKMLTDDVCKLGLIIVDSTKRGKGYGRAMVSCALDLAKKLGAKKAVLSVFDNNSAAYECYKKLGFSENGSFTEHTVCGETRKYLELEYCF